MGAASSALQHPSSSQILAAFPSLSRVRSLNSSAHFESLFNIRWKGNNGVEPAALGSACLLTHPPVGWLF